MQVGQCSCPNQFFVLYGLANAVDPDYCSAPYRLANVVLKSFLRAIQVGQCSWPKSLLRAILVGRIRYLSMPYRSANAVGPIHFSVSYGLAGYDPIHVIQVGQCTWTKSFPRAIQVGRIRYLSASYRSANAVGPNHCSVPYRLAGSDPYPCHTGRPMQLAQIISPCHTGWPDPIPIHVIQVSQCTWPKSLLHAIQVGRI
jgi:hypothetical protein